jgi:zinc transporter ZupT
MLLALAGQLSSRIAFTFFLAMIGHKGYEALSVSLLLQQRLKTNREFAIYALSYALSLPAGVIFTWGCTHFFGAQLGPSLMRGFAMVAASVAIGSLLGCMMHDFVQPALRQIRIRTREAGWVALGVLLTLIFTNGS